MVSGTRVTSVLFILLLASYGAWSQVSAEGESCCQSRSLMPSFPEAPSIHVLAQTGTFNSVLENTSVANLSFIPPAAIGSSVADIYGPTISLEQSDSFLEKCLYWSLPKNQPTYHASSDGGVLSRAIDAAPQLVITRNEAGERVLNTSYLLRALTFAAADTAHRPAWAQSSSGTFSDFGSSVGSDAGMNVYHEFQSNLWHILDSHSPKFVKRLEGLAKNSYSP
jgi:hypothetical protein